MPLGPDRCNGPSGYMNSTIPPPTLKRAEGLISDYTSYYIHIIFMSKFVTLFIPITVSHLIYCSNRVLYTHWFFILICQSSLWILYFGMDCGYRLWVYIMLLIDISFDIRTARVQCRGLHPPPRSRAPRQESRTSWSVMWTHVLLLELRNCTLLSVEVWMHRGIVLSWDRKKKKLCNQTEN